MAYLDDIYVVCMPDRVVDLFNVVSTELAARAGVRINLGKCAAWNRGGSRPDRLEELEGLKWARDLQLPTGGRETRSPPSQLNHARGDAKRGQPPHN